HPLPADDANLEGIVRRAENVNKNDRAPDKDHHGQTERDQGPKDLQPEGSLNGSGAFILSATAIFDGEENNHEKDQRYEENRNGDKKKQKRVHLWRHGRGLLRKQGKPEIHASATPPGLQFATALPAKHDRDESSESDHGDNSPEADDVSNQETVFSSRGVVVITEEQQLIDGRRNLVSRGLDESQS